MSLETEEGLRVQEHTLTSDYVLADFVNYQTTCRHSIAHKHKNVMTCAN